jgi:predicted RNA-binding Zn ribbon-like protein
MQLAMDRLLVSFLNTALEHPDPLESAFGAAKWWASVHGLVIDLAPAVDGKPRFDPALLKHLCALRATLTSAERPVVAFSGSSATDTVLFPLAYAAAAFFSSNRVKRLKTCAHEPCSRYFLDETKNGSRRWCSLRCMERARAPRRRTIGK